MPLDLLWPVSEQPAARIAAHVDILPELLALYGVVQDKEHHPEGDAFIHTIHTINAAHRIAQRESMQEYETIILLNTMLCHDLGKATTTVVHEDGRITAHGHPDAGVVPTMQLLARIGYDPYTISLVVPLVREHMAWVGYFTPEITDRAIRRLARRLMPATMELWIHVVEADISGRPPKPAGIPAKAREMLEIARKLGVNNGLDI